MPPIVIAPRARRPGVWRSAALGALAATAAVMGYAAGCSQHRADQASANGAPDADSPSVCLGNLRLGRAPSARQVALSEFLFGAAPDDPVGIIKPVAVRATGDAIWVADSGHRAVWIASGDATSWQAAPLTDPPAFPTAIAADDAEAFVCDPAAKVVLRVRPGSGAATRYTLPEGSDFKPTGVLRVDSALWVANAATHGIEVFDLESARHSRTLGRRGRGRVEFTMPLGMARLAGGDVAVVDSLGRRVQVLTPDGQWRGQIGQPGITPGTFGRPKDVAVGPDGVVFVADATARCVHAFDESGRFLAAFGADGGHALAMPVGVAVVPSAPSSEQTASSGFNARYYVLVAEQVARPGIRVFAWRGPKAESQEQSPAAGSVNVRTTAKNPHWTPDGCRTCHGTAEPRAIPVAESDDICIRCHDGHQATAESHPVGGPAVTDRTRMPADWPLSSGRLACLTCHNVIRHCRTDVTRPIENPAMVRDFRPDQPLNFCTQCHMSETWRTNPHTERVVGRMAGMQSCGFCHRPVPQIPADGRPLGSADLRQPTTDLCLNCHQPHADPAPQGHLGARMAGTPPTSLAERFPLDDNRVTCSSCHNPHAAGLFANGTPLDARATAPEDAEVRLRADYGALCTACHPK